MKKTRQTKLNKGSQKQISCLGETQPSPNVHSGTYMPVFRREARPCASTCIFLCFLSQVRVNKRRITRYSQDSGISTTNYFLGCIYIITPFLIENLNSSAQVALWLVYCLFYLRRPNRYRRFPCVRYCNTPFRDSSAHVYRMGRC